MSFPPRHACFYGLQPADNLSVRPEVCSDLAADATEVTAKTTSEKLSALKQEVAQEQRLERAGGNSMTA